MSFYSEGVKVYKDILDKSIENAISKLESNSNISYTFVNLKLFDEIEITIDDRTKKYKLHEFHYGPIWNQNTKAEGESDNVYHWRKFITRDLSVFLNQNNMTSYLTTFQSKQIDLIKNNYYLVDLSDTKHDIEKDKVFYDIKIVLYKTKPHKPIKRWHSYGYIPNLGSPKIKNTIVKKKHTGFKKSDQKSDKKPDKKHDKKHDKKSDKKTYKKNFKNKSMKPKYYSGYDDYDEIPNAMTIEDYFKQEMREIVEPLVKKEKQQYVVDIFDESSVKPKNPLLFKKDEI